MLAAPSVEDNEDRGDQGSFEHMLIIEIPVAVCVNVTLANFDRWICIPTNDRYEFESWSSISRTLSQYTSAGEVVLEIYCEFSNLP